MVKSDYLAPKYTYADKIIPPDKVLDDHMITKDGKTYIDITGPNYDGLNDSVGAMISYMVLNTEGKNTAKKSIDVIDRELGNKFFLKTMLECKDIKTKKKVPRHIYLSNVSTGKYPLLGDVTTDMKGLVPGIISNLETFNPFKAVQELIGSSTPDCVKIKLETIGNIPGEKPGSSQAYVTIADLKDLKNQDMHYTRDGKEEQYDSECIDNWDKGIDKCNNSYQKKSEPFLNRILNFNKSNKNNDDNDIMPVYEVYYASISILIMYIMYRLIYNVK